MRVVTVVLREDESALVTPARVYMGEHRAVRMEITLPQRLREGFDYYTIAFDVMGAGRRVPMGNIYAAQESSAEGMAWMQDGVITCDLPDSLTQCSFLRAQVEAHQEEDGRCVKLEKSAPFVLAFEDSIAGEGDALSAFALGHMNELMAQLHELRATLRMKVEGADEVVDGLLEQAGTEIAQARDQAVATVQQAVAAAQGTASQAANAAAQSAALAGQKATDAQTAANRAETAALNAANNANAAIQAAVSQAASQVQTASAQALGTLNSAAIKAIADVNGSASQAAVDLNSTASQAVADIQASAALAVNEVQTTAGQAVSVAQSAASRAETAAAQAQGIVDDSAAAAAAQAAEAVRDEVGQSAGEAAAAAALAEDAASRAETAATQAQGIVDNSVAAAAAAAAAQAAEAVRDEVGQSAGEAAAAAAHAEDAASRAETAAAQAQDLVLNAAEELASGALGGAPGLVRCRLLAEGEDYSRSGGLMEYEEEVCGQTFTVFAYQPISVQAGAPQTYSVPATLDLNHLTSQNFPCIDPTCLMLTASDYVAQFVKVESGAVSGSFEAGFTLAATLLLTDSAGQSARMELTAALNASSQNGALEMTVTPLFGQGEMTFVLYAIKAGIAPHPEPRSGYAITLDFAQPVGPMDEFAMVFRSHMVGDGTKQLIKIARSASTAVISLSPDSDGQNLPALWDGDTLQLVLQPGADAATAMVLDAQMQNLIVEQVIKKEVMGGNGNG
ncbi:MAG: hypothetical protein LBG83_07525 [Oscillospiraceae bacterium]|jgi:hypothetical protein|nr:hypothetical protein [Oscillospiraceae bacterium]